MILFICALQNADLDVLAKQTKNLKYNEWKFRVQPKLLSFSILILSVLFPHPGHTSYGGYYTKRGSRQCAANHIIHPLGSFYFCVEVSIYLHSVGISSILHDLSHISSSLGIIGVHALGSNSTAVVPCCKIYKIC